MDRRPGVPARRLHIGEQHVVVGRRADAGRGDADGSSPKIVQPGRPRLLPSALAEVLIESPGGARGAARHLPSGIGREPGPAWRGMAEGSKAVMVGPASGLARGCGLACSASFGLLPRLPSRGGGWAGAVHVSGRLHRGVDGGTDQGATGSGRGGQAVLQWRPRSWWAAFRLVSMMCLSFMRPLMTRRLPVSRWRWPLAVRSGRPRPPGCSAARNGLSPAQGARFSSTGPRSSRMAR